MTYICTIDSPMGTLTAASDGKHIVGLWLAGQKYFAATMEKETKEKDLPVFQSLRTWLQEYFAGKKMDIFPLLAPQGSEFRQSVWKILCEIPYGQVITYGDIATKLKSQTGKNQSAQAVGGAVGHNPISILIPCHRVVGAGGSLTGYAGGIDKKIRLLELEKVVLDKFYIPKKGTAL